MIYLHPSIYHEIQFLQFQKNPWNSLYTLYIYHFCTQNSSIFKNKYSKAFINYQCCFKVALMKIMSALCPTFIANNFFLSSFFTFHRIHEGVEHGRGANIFRKVINSNFHCHFWIQHGKCIQMSTNKPSIGPVVLELASWILRRKCWNFKFSAQKKWPSMEIINFFCFNFLNHLLNWASSISFALPRLDPLLAQKISQTCNDKTFAKKKILRKKIGGKDSCQSWFKATVDDFSLTSIKNTKRLRETRNLWGCLTNRDGKNIGKMNEIGVNSMRWLKT